MWHLRSGAVLAAMSGGMMKSKRFLRLFAASILSTTAAPEAANAAETYLRVVDVGNAMCVVVKIPGGHHILYDAGNFNSDECAAAVREIVGPDRLDLVVLSHSDADHIGELPNILSQNQADLVVYTGAQGTSAITWPRVVSALERAKRAGTRVRNLARQPLPNTRRPRPGRARAAPLKIRLGDATVTFVTGFHSWTLPGDQGFEPNESERRNAISIVVRLDYGGKSVLLTGDTIGRRGRASEQANACRDAERWMIREGNVSVDSDVLVGQHHGGDNSSSGCFIEAVSPEFVIFPAGHARHKHPRASAAQRFLDRDVSLAKILRTDRGDDEPGDEEWGEGLEQGCIDPRGDDDVEVFLSDRPADSVRVRYRQPLMACPS